MTRVARSITIPADAATIWRIVADLTGWPRWMDAPYTAESVTIVSGEAGPGCEFELKGRLPFRLAARIVQWEACRSLRFEVLRSEYPSDRLFLARAAAGFALERLDNRATRVTYDHVVEGKGLLGRLYMATVFRLFLRGNARRVLAGLQRVAHA